MNPLFTILLCTNYEITDENHNYNTRIKLKPIKHNHKLKLYESMSHFSERNFFKSHQMICDEIIQT